MPETRPYGSWPSPITAELLTRGGRRLSSPVIDGDDVWFAESRPEEAGRVVLRVRRADGTTLDAVPEGVNVRTAVHEYGGGAWLVRDGVAVYADFADQRLHRVAPGAEPVAITPAPAEPRTMRYADGRFRPGTDEMVWVREWHGPDGVVNDLVRVWLDGSREPEVVASGHDFFASPRFSPDGSRLAFLAWDQPRMPWDGTELHVAEVRADGSLGEPSLVAGGPDESIFQPEWSPAGVLHFVSDRSGWWNLHALGSDGPRALAPREEEFGTPAWIFGYATYGFLDDGRIVCRREASGTTPVGILDPATGELLDLDLPFEVVQPMVAASGARIALLVGGPRRAAAIVVLDLRAADVDVVAEAEMPDVDPAYLAVPRPIAFPTAGGTTAFGYHYPPTNPGVVAPEGERPPLLVLSHGGPTAAVDTELNLEIQYFTSRGFAVVDVNYRGSTGYGRAYRRALNGLWGIADVEDCSAAAAFLAEEGHVDPTRVVASGGSAGGWTTLCLLAFGEGFAAGTSYYGVSDLAALAEDTHKFEARYLDSLVAPWPSGRAVYEERSPLHHADRLTKPMLVLQGLDDRVVPPSQSEALVAALAGKGIPHAYVTFEGEGHGFRKSANIVRALESELSFYAQVLGFAHPEDVPVLPLVR